MSAALNLLSCPCCGGKAQFDSDVEQTRVMCAECGISTRSYFTASEAASVWNRRTSDSDTVHVAVSVDVLPAPTDGNS